MGLAHFEGLAASPKVARITNRAEADAVQWVDILARAKIDPGIRAKDLTEAQLSQIVHAIQDGKYAHAPLPDPALGPRKVDVPVMYNAERFRPRYDGKLGDPMLLVILVAFINAWRSSRDSDWFAFFFTTSS